MRERVGSISESESATLPVNEETSECSGEISIESASVNTLPALSVTLKNSVQIRMKFNRN